MSGSRRGLLRSGWLARSARRGWRAASARALSLLFPPACTHCHREMDEPADQILLCAACRGAFDPGKASYCLRCGALRPGPGDDRQECELCPETPPAYDAVVTLGRYRGPLREAVFQMKVPAGEPLARALARLFLLRRAATLTSHQPDLLVPVPMFWRRRIHRGTNSPEVLAEEIARALNIPALPDALVRRRNTSIQRRLPPADRFRNVHHAFQLRKGYDLRGLRVALVDDVLTTGATCSEAARVLRQAGADSVVVAAIARGGGRDAPSTD